MENNQNFKIQYGDYQLLGLMLDISSMASRMRYKRNDKEAVDAMRMIQEYRRSLIENFKKKK